MPAAGAAGAACVARPREHERAPRRGPRRARPAADEERAVREVAAVGCRRGAGPRRGSAAPPPRAGRATRAPRSPAPRRSRPRRTRPAREGRARAARRADRRRRARRRGPRGAARDAGSDSSQSPFSRRSPARSSSDAPGPTKPRLPATGALPGCAPTRDAARGRRRARRARAGARPRGPPALARGAAGSAARALPARSRSASARAASRPVPGVSRPRKPRPDSSTATAQPEVASGRPSSAGTVPVFAWKPNSARPAAVPSRALSRSPASSSRRSGSLEPPRLAQQCRVRAQERRRLGRDQARRARQPDRRFGGQRVGWAQARGTQRAGEHRLRRCGRERAEVGVAGDGRRAHQPDGAVARGVPAARGRSAAQDRRGRAPGARAPTHARRTASRASRSGAAPAARRGVRTRGRPRA